MASFPTSVKSWTALVDGTDYPQAAQLNEARDEINAIEAGYLNGTARLNSSNSTVANLSVSGNSTFAGTANVVGTITSGIWNAGAVTSSGAVTGVAGTFSGLLTSSGFGVHGVIGAGAGTQQWSITNTTSGAAALSSLFLRAGTQENDINAYSQGFTTSGVNIASSVLVRAQNGGGLTLAATNASGVIRLIAGGTTVRMLINANGTQTWAPYGAGTATFDSSGNITSVSDRRFKDRIRPLPYGLAEVLKLKSVQHGYNAKSGLERKHLYGGFIAQDVQRVIPLAVGRDARGYLTLADRPILGAIVNAVKELHAQLAAVEATIAA